MLEDFLGAILLDAPAVVYHHVSIPTALLAMFHEVLMKLLTLFINDSPGLLGNSSR